MIEYYATVKEEMLLRNADFPANSFNMQDPDDYKEVPEPFVESIPHFPCRHNKLVVRGIPDNTYLPMTFACDTGVPMGLFLSEKAMREVQACNRVELDKEHKRSYTVVKSAGSIAIDYTPPGHAPAKYGHDTLYW